MRALDRYPDAVELNRVVRAHGPQAVFITVEQADKVVAIAEQLEQLLPGIQIIAAGDFSNPQTLMALMRGGVREIVNSPFDAKTVHESIVRAQDNLRKRPVSIHSTEFIYSFLPSKPGVGASTIAVNAALGIAKQEPNGGLLADFDLNSGIIRFLLKLDSAYTVLDAAERAANLDEQTWGQIVCKSNGLDVLHTGTLNPEMRLDALHLRDLIGYARRNYKAICFDLSGNLEKYALELMQESRRIFLVCTPEVCSLYLAREKMQYLKRLDLGDRVSILLNRFYKRSPIGTSEVEDLVRAPVLMTFQNDYNRITAAIAAGGAVEANSELGERFAALSSYMLGKQKTPTSTKRRFVEYFNITSGKATVDQRS